MKNTEEYLIANLQRALATDPRVNVQDIKVSVSNDLIRLQGQVTTERRKQAAADVVKELAPQFKLGNELEVVQLKEPNPAEVVK